MRYLSAGLLSLLFFACVIPLSAVEKPNIIFILADDLGYGDVGCYGQKKIKTPRLDQMAAEGIRFTQFYAGSTVCAPSRSVLITGYHTGHTRVRGNSGPETQTLLPNDVTVPKVLKRAGYSTALIGKWGLGDEGNTGRPNDQGFDFFYGYLNQVHAHNYYPSFLWRNETKEPLRNVVQLAARAYAGFHGGWATKRVDYTHDLFMDESLKWIDAHKDEPFFLYIPLTIPHANNEATRGDPGDGQEVPDYGIYKDKDWSNPDKGQAAMVTRMDTGVGMILDQLDKLKIAKKTLVIFSSDNGHHAEGGNDPEFFDANGPLRGKKRDLYEGGIRVPTIMRWKGVTKPGQVSDHIGYFADLLATAADLAGVEAPSDTDGISFAPLLRNQPAKQRKHEYLYWEFYEGRSAQAIRYQQYKAVRVPAFTGEIELFDVSKDIGEQNDIAKENPHLVQRLLGYMKAEHRPDPNWKVRTRKR